MGSKASSVTFFLYVNIVFVFLLSNPTTSWDFGLEPTPNPIPTSNQAPTFSPSPISNPSPVFDPDSTPNPISTSNQVPTSNPTPVSNTEPTPNPDPTSDQAPTSNPTPVSNPAEPPTQAPTSNPVSANSSTPNPNASPTVAPGGNCSLNPLRIAKCIRFLASPFSFTSESCCQILANFLERQASTCICPAVQARRIGIKLDITLLNRMLNKCGMKGGPIDFQCA